MGRALINDSHIIPVIKKKAIREGNNNDKPAMDKLNDPENADKDNYESSKNCEM